MFAPYDIVDPSDRFLEDEEDGSLLLAAISSIRWSRAVWFVGGTLCVLGISVFATSLGPWGMLTRDTAQLRKVPKAPVVSALAQFPPQAQNPVVQTTQIYKPPGSGPTVEGQPAPAVGEQTQGSSSPETGSSKVVEEHLRVTSATSIYEGPSGSADVVGTAYPGAEGIVVSREPNWVQLADPITGRTGWIRSAFLAPVTEDSAPTEAALPSEEDLASSADVKPHTEAKKVPRRYVGRRALRVLRRFLR